MASYVESVLIPGEQVVHLARVSKWSLAPMLFFGVLLLPVVIGLFLLLWAWIRYATTELAITNKRVIAKTGLIQRKTIEMFISKVESVQVDQGILGRMFDFGTVTLTGTGVQSAPFRSIADPLLFRKSFMSAADTPAAKAG